MYSDDVVWQAMYLIMVRCVTLEVVSFFLGPAPSTLCEWHKQYEATGRIRPNRPKERPNRRLYSDEMVTWIQDHVLEQPMLYLHEMQEHFAYKFPGHRIPSEATICRALAAHDPPITRKRVMNAARQSCLQDRLDFLDQIKTFVTSPDQLIVIDETSKNARANHRRYGRGPSGKEVIEKAAFDRELGVSCLASFTIDGFQSISTRETHNRQGFLSDFVIDILPHIQEYPLENSILICDGARTHCTWRLYELCMQKGAVVIFMPRYPLPPPH
ncbi:hypothetical protein KIPB_012115 [Kipferlia bialata]|uniref:Uncharacterized protein n=1 Tax=Kipferlia bialata TaxID=797122 RepID=A0A391NZT4_9EUKA|nr:hypothetical protein KIPB_012115 [Kipferlia bialata]|eukprot:g12115.t1